ncbi:MAG: septum formation inhibitor Maf [Paracoccus denitrificans]|uniref:dTTP/UTP pyrophosphatase n=1 Tax=Paracoccus denitrificans TaxID=266 RepID=A0A533IAB5_PARDE|nr:MAG: septum formation inhibitor Maf [Paracoccus denitrificans]
MTQTDTLRLVLGSVSPRRLDLLAQIGFIPDAVRPADIDETPHRHEAPRDYVQRMATEKCAAIVAADDEIVLTADTVVVAGRRILGKPADRQQAKEFLTLLGGRRHRVMTAVALRHRSKSWLRLVETIVRMRPLSPAEIEAYLGSDEWQGKAGGYAVQGRAGAFVSWMSGSFSAVVGLPLAETAMMLKAAGKLPAEKDKIA